MAEPGSDIKLQSSKLPWNYGVVKPGSSPWTSQLPDTPHAQAPGVVGLYAPLSAAARNPGTPKQRESDASAQVSDFWLEDVRVVQHCATVHQLLVTFK